MELHLQRTYYATGTNGTITWDGHFLCYSIELPWKGNRRKVSCIPEGRYSLEMRYSPRLEDHLQVEHVPNRTLILIHPADDALKQLKGCIAPVSELIGPGKGEDSEVAFLFVRKLVYNAIDSGERVWITIESSKKM